MSRKLAVLFVIALICAGWVVMNKITTVNDFQIPLAFGFPTEEIIELHAVATMGMTANEPPRLDPKTGKVDWPGWVEGHFDLRDPQGQKVHIAFMQHSDVIKPAKVVGTPEGYLLAKIKKGVDYSFDYIPKLAGSKPMRYQFTAPSQDKPLEWCRFERV